MAGRGSVPPRFEWRRAGSGTGPSSRGHAGPARARRRRRIFRARPVYIPLQTGWGAPPGMSAMRSWLRARLPLLSAPRPNVTAVATVAAHRASTIAEWATSESPPPRQQRHQHWRQQRPSRCLCRARWTRPSPRACLAVAAVSHAASASAPPQSESPGRASPPTIGRLCHGHVLFVAGQPGQVRNICVCYGSCLAPLWSDGPCSVRNRHC